MYKRLTKKQRQDVGRMAVAKYNNIDNRMQEEWDKDPTYLLHDGKPGKHAPFAGEYAEDMVHRVLEQEYGKSKAFTNGWGVKAEVIQEIVAFAIGYRKELVAMKVCRERAHAPGAEL